MTFSDAARAAGDKQSDATPQRMSILSDIFFITQRTGLKRPGR
jgi:hypothetical protein